MKLLFTIALICSTGYIVSYGIGNMLDKDWAMFYHFWKDAAMLLLAVYALKYTKHEYHKSFIWILVVASILAVLYVLLEWSGNWDHALEIISYSLCIAFGICFLGVCCAIIKRDKKVYEPPEWIGKNK